MDQQVPALLQRDHDELAIALDGGDAAAGKARRQIVGVAAAQDAQIAELGGDHAASDNGRERACHGFDFGKFGHSGRAHDPSLMNLSLAQRPSAVRADSVESVNGALGAADGVGLLSDHNLQDRFFRHLGKLGHLEKRHAFS